MEGEGGGGRGREVEEEGGKRREVEEEGGKRREVEEEGGIYYVELNSQAATVRTVTEITNYM